MLATYPRSLYLTGSLLALSMAATALPGLLVPGFYEPFLTRYGLAYAQVFMQDLATVLLLPILAWSMLAARRGSARGVAVWGGVCVYALYYYSFYGFDKLYTPLYPLYLAVMGLGAWSLVGLLAGTDAKAFAALADARLPVRFCAAVLAVPLLFVPIWLSMLFAGIAAKKAAPAATVFPLDLCFLIPAAAWAAAALWRRKPIGYLAGGILLVKAVISGVVLAGGTLYQLLAGERANPGELALYLVLALPGAAALGLFLKRLGPAEKGAAPGAAAPGATPPAAPGTATHGASAPGAR